MNQKQKIIIFLSSLLCGSPIIFLAFRDNEQKNKQKNNLKINQQKIEKKEENKKEKEKQLITVPKKDKENKSSSFLFWIIIGIIIIVLIIFGIKIYQRSIKEKKNNLDNFIDDDSSSSGSLSPKKQKTKQNDPLEEKKLLKCGIVINEKSIDIVLSKNPDAQNAIAIDSILKDDITNQPPLTGIENARFYADAPIDDFRNYIQAMLNFLKTYITGQCLENIFNQNGNIDCYILSEMANKYNESQKVDEIVLHSIDIDNVKESPKNEELLNQILSKIEKGQYADLLSFYLYFPDIVFIEDKNKQKHFLFLKLFKLCTCFNSIYQNLVNFVQITQPKTELEKEISNALPKTGKFFKNKST